MSNADGFRMEGFVPGGNPDGSTYEGPLDTPAGSEAFRRWLVRLPPYLEMMLPKEQRAEFEGYTWRAVYAGDRQTESDFSSYIYGLNPTPVWFETHMKVSAGWVANCIAAGAGDSGGDLAAGPRLMVAQFGVDPETRQGWCLWFFLPSLA
ncbi:hypothetical protein [Longimicrobium sp.]|jgi:hypothetical protein|uniref:hypothetical protein n=1 Tax=Longimicrobium sp. TaxID=2029185 RepID=UPI002F9435AA